MILVWILLLGLLVSMNPCVVAGKEGQKGRKEGGFDPFLFSSFSSFNSTFVIRAFLLWHRIVPVLVALRERAL